MTKPKKTAELENLKDAYQTHGRRIEKVYDAGNGWKSYPGKTVVPPASKLLNFDLEFGMVEKHKDGHKVTRNRTILCLDNYGNEIMCSKVHKNLMNGLDIFDYLLGIDRESGEIYCVSFLTESKKLGVAFSPLVPGQKIVVPKAWMDRLDELMCKKRPWFVTLPDTALFSFMERFYGYNDLGDTLLVDLEFDKLRLQVGSRMHRVVSDWR